MRNKNSIKVVSCNAQGKITFWNKHVTAPKVTRRYLNTLTA